MKKSIKQYPIDQCAFYKLRSKKKLEKLLHMDPGEAKSYVGNLKYHSFNIAKKSGGFRTIEAPDKKLKQWQRRVLDLLVRIEKPSYVISASKGKCHVDNAKIHQQNGFVLTMDIAGFYDSCQREYVYQFFSTKLCCDPDIAAILTDICTYRSSIPVGSPASQIIAYFAYEEMFGEIELLSRSLGCDFSLYVDDMTFSSPIDFSWKWLRNRVRMILNHYGHKLKESKTHYFSRKKNKIITGVNLTPDKMLTAPNNLRHRILDNAHAYKRTRSTDLIPVIQGQIQAANYIEDRLLFQQLKSEIL